MQPDMLAIDVGDGEVVTYQYFFAEVCTPKFLPISVGGVAGSPGNVEFLFAVTHSASLASMRGDNATPIEKPQVVSRRSKDVK